MMRGRVNRALGKKGREISNVDSVYRSNQHGPLEFGIKLVLPIATRVDRAGKVCGVRDAGAGMHKQGAIPEN